MFKCFFLFHFFVIVYLYFRPLRHDEVTLRTAGLLLGCFTNFCGYEIFHFARFVSMHCYKLFITYVFAFL